MSWIFGDINFETYGVMVSRSSGVLDLPKLQFEGFNWLDEHGLDYWQDEPKYSDREIILNCWMIAEKDETGSGYENFRTKVQAFTDAIKAAGKVSFVTPYITIDDCSISRGITVIRETNYVYDVQAGTFTLRITVHGDSEYELVNICRVYGDNIVAVAKTRNLQIRKTLQGDMYATMSFESNTKLDIQYFDHIRVNTNGVNVDIFHIETEPEFRKISSNKYAYTLRLEHQMNWLSHTQFMFDGESDFYFYGDLETIVELIISNHSRSGYNKFLKGTIVSTVKKNHKFSGEDCLSVLKRLCSEYNLEFEFEYIPVQVKYYINVKSQVSNDKAVTLQYGKGNGLYEITREAMLKDEMCTYLFAFGAAKNLKYDYRGGLQRLSFTGNPLQQNVELYGYHEKTVFFDDIFPNRTSTITEYYQVLKEDLTDAQKEVHPTGIYRITDSTIDFDINGYLLGGLTAKIRLKTGNLAGHEFEIEKYDHDFKHIYIIPLRDEQDAEFPSSVLMPESGDEYTLVDIDQPESYVTVAEEALEAQAIAYLAEHSTPKFPYMAKVHPAFMLANPGGFEVGDRITLIDVDYNIDGQFRISELIYNSLSKIYEFRLSDRAIPSRLQRTDLRLKSIERSIEDTKKDTVESMRKEHETAVELRNRLLDPADMLLSTDRIVRVKSLDPGMLALDASTIQWSIKDALVDCNVDGDYDKVTIGAGTITYHNWETKDRYNISKAKDTVEGYQPQRTWTVEATEFNLLSPDAHWMYAKLNLASGSTSCVILVDTEHIEGKYEIEDNYLYLKLGDITSSASPRYASMIWGNVKNPTLSHITEIITESVPDIVSQTIINEGDTIVNIVKNEAPVVLGGYKESFLIENTTNTTETQYSTWAVIAFNELVGEFKAMILVRNKVSHTIVSLMNILSFDYTDPANEVVKDNAMLTDGTITLALGIDPVTKLLFATVAGMPTDAKRIHFCFERCVLGERIVEMGNAEGNIEFGGEGEIMALEDNYLGNAEGNIELGGEAALEAPEDNYMGDAEGNIEFGGEGTMEDSTPPVIPVNFGLLYNYHAILNARGFIQSGWRLPTQTELNALDDVYGVAGLKEAGTDYWTTDNGTNTSGFTGRGSGYRRNTDGGFQNVSENMIFWGSTISSGRVRCGNLTDATIYTVPLYYYVSGMSVRPIKDSTILAEGETTEDGYTDNDGNSYPTVCIGGKEYVAANLKQTKYNDGTPIAEITDDAAWIADTVGAMCAYNNDWDNV